MISQESHSSITEWGCAEHPVVQQDWAFNSFCGISFFYGRGTYDLVIFVPVWAQERPGAKGAVKSYLSRLASTDAVHRSSR